MLRLIANRPAPRRRPHDHRDFVDLCTAVYVLVDDLYQRGRGPAGSAARAGAACTDSEVITLTLVAELVGLDEECRFLAYVRRNRPTLFPHLPERSRYNRRRRRLIEVTNRIRIALAARRAAST